MTIEIYWGSGSPYSWRVLLAAEFKGLDYTSKLLSFRDGDIKKPEYLALNPRGKVPAVRDGDVVLYESIAILAWMDRQYPEPPIFGATPVEAAEVWRLVQEHLCYVEAPLFDALGGLIFPGIPEDEAAIRALLPKAHAELERLERLLTERTWLAGVSPSAADFVTYPAMAYLMRVATKEQAAKYDLTTARLDDAYPSLRAWMGRVEQMPGFDRTYPPHWKG